MKSIRFQTEGWACADAKAEEEARKFLTGSNTYIIVSTANFIEASRALICEGLIPNTEVEFLFEDQKITADTDGRIQTWPKGFCDHAEGWIMRLLHGRGKR